MSLATNELYSVQVAFSSSTPISIHPTAYVSITSNTLPVSLLSPRASLKLGYKSPWSKGHCHCSLQYTLEITDGPRESEDTGENVKCK